MAVILGDVLHRHHDPGAPVRRAARGRDLGAGADRARPCSATRRSSTSIQACDGADPDPGREHELRGLPAAGLDPGADRFLPHQFTFRGDRLAFSNGIIVLGVAAAVLLVVFDADVDKLIPLYAFGVFVSFTLSQSGMVVHWLRLRGAGLAAQHRRSTASAPSRRRRRGHRRRHEVQRRRVDQHARDGRPRGHVLGDLPALHRASSASSRCRTARICRDRARGTGRPCWSRSTR